MRLNILNANRPVRLILLLNVLSVYRRSYQVCPLVIPQHIPLKGRVTLLVVGLALKFRQTFESGPDGLSGGEHLH